MTPQDGCLQKESRRMRWIAKKAKASFISSLSIAPAFLSFQYYNCPFAQLFLASSFLSTVVVPGQILFFPVDDDIALPFLVSGKRPSGSSSSSSGKDKTAVRLAKAVRNTVTTVVCQSNIVTATDSSSSSSFSVLNGMPPSPRCPCPYVTELLL